MFGCSVFQSKPFRPEKLIQTREKQTDTTIINHTSVMTGWFICLQCKTINLERERMEGWMKNYLSAKAFSPLKNNTHKSMYDLLKINISSEACLPLDCSITWETSTYWYVWISQVSQSHIMKTCVFFPPVHSRKQITLMMHLVLIMFLRFSRHNMKPLRLSLK